MAGPEKSAAIHELRSVEPCCLSILLCMLDRLCCFAGRPVFLDMTVKVKEKWRKSHESLNEFGY